MPYIVPKRGYLLNHPNLRQMDHMWIYDPSLLLRSIDEEEFDSKKDGNKQHHKKWMTEIVEHEKQQAYNK